MLLCGPAISNRRISSSLFAREKIHRKHEETAEHTGRDRGRERESFRTFVKAVPLLTLEEFDGPKLSRPQHPQQYASKMP